MECGDVATTMISKWTWEQDRATLVTQVEDLKFQYDRVLQENAALKQRLRCVREGPCGAWGPPRLLRHRPGSARRTRA